MPLPDAPIFLLPLLLNNAPPRQLAEDDLIAKLPAPNAPILLKDSTTLQENTSTGTTALVTELRRVQTYDGGNVTACEAQNATAHHPNIPPPPPTQPHAPQTARRGRPRHQIPCTHCSDPNEGLCPDPYEGFYEATREWINGYHGVSD
ncbi:hypothetical protein M378DRAFT_17034 [Amanita muscaria Koide BX008]|uniref:Uncharacterized protein n=1 Tax=Amanita muscaria (strain Koide BX008) TaxID=946122 RepID=A0A0C2WJZ0_AMAMK|nr:hypothetical protein M378DRAFT_17034 [Amanita muscaria Koide BX008]